MDALVLEPVVDSRDAIMRPLGGGGSGLVAWGKLDAWDLFVFTCTR